jgi:serine/threonine protein kinase
VVGRWSVVAWAGNGIHGSVYRAVPVDDAQGPPVALKLALLPRDPRFAREVELLSRLRHPSIPRLMDAGEWQHPGGTHHPYLAMEWVDGVPLYDWAQQHPPSGPQVLRLLAQLTSALQAIHAQGAVHRDVKGDNVLVRSSDGRAVLTDFGSGNYPGAATLTPSNLYPGTPAYRAPESWLFELQFSRDVTSRYAARPADDLYALGVTGCRLVTGEYPELGEPSKDRDGTWHLKAVRPPASLARTEPHQRAVILRMLSVRPEERGTAAQLAKALEQAAAAFGPGSSSHLRDVPEALTSEPHEIAAPLETQGRLPEESSLARSSVERAGPRAHARPRRLWLPMAAAGLALTAWVWWIAQGKPVEGSASARGEATAADPKDAGTTGLGEAAATVASSESAPEVDAPAVMAEDTLPEPQPGQVRPDAKGQCPHKLQVALNGGCWAEFRLNREECEGKGGYVFKTTCYLPIHPRGRPPTSSPANKR